MTPQRRTWLAATAVALGVLVAGACAPSVDGDNLGEEVDDAPPTSAAEAVTNRTDTLHIARLEPPQSGGTAVGGTILLYRDGDGAPVTLQIDAVGLPPGEHAWHIHQGSCGTSHAVAIALSPTAEMEGITGPLEVGDDGAAQEELEVPELMPSTVGAERHSLHVHERPGTDHGPTIACATI